MPLSPGTTIGPYSITAKIGEGGMGEVWQARDTKLDRDVALKVLPEAFTADPDRLARFEREAKMLASLNHPNIGSIYGLEEAEGVRALVLELVEGPTLADRITQGPIQLDEALPIAKQIAEALEAAHEKGVIHRDLKPANIKVKDDGTVKVLDFGLAKAFQPDGGAPNMSQSPTISLTAAATQMGMVIGTAAYMSPEQASGKAVDKRADVWAFGVVLYEMLTGTRPFVGDDVSKTLAHVIAIDPDWSTLPKNVPPVLGTFLRGCLEKNQKQRVGDIRDMRLAMEGAFETTGSTPTEPGVGPALPVWQRPVAIAAAVLASLAVGGVAVWTLTRPGPPPADPVVRFSVPLGAEQAFTPISRHLVALSPDGTQLVYQTDSQLYLRRLDQLEATAIPGTQEGDGRSPFISPDGEWIGFWAGGQLKKVAMSGGAAVTLGDVTNPWGVSWGADDMILVGQGPNGIWRVPGTGGTPEVVITIEDGEQAHGPQMLPGGEWVLFTLLPAGVNSWNEAHIVVQSLVTDERVVLIEGGRDARYVETGHLVYALNGVVFAVAFDRDARQVLGGPVPLVEGVRGSLSATGAVHFSVARNGSLIYVPGGGSGERRLVWVDRRGEEEPLATRADNYVTLHLSPDGARAAVSILDGSGNSDVWVSDVVRGTLTRLTTDDAFDGRPLWHPDGRRVAFRSDRNGQPEVFWQAADGSGTAERLLTIDESVTDIVPYDWSPDGATLFVSATFRETGSDVGMVSIEGPGTWEPLIQTAARETWPTISPDGRWLAYASNETGSFEVYVQRFPELEGKQPISVGGGTLPHWSADGSELFYGRGGPPDAMMRVTIEGDEGDPPSLTVGTPERLLGWRYLLPGVGIRHYDVSPEGQRFLMITTGGSADAGAGIAEINVVLNWTQELLERVPIP